VRVVSCLQEFNKRQQFKQQMKRLTDEKEEQDREIQIMNEQRDELMREIEEIENNRNKLMAEFYHLKESLAPILTKTVTISDELDKQRLGGVVDATDDQELELESADAPSSSGGGKKDKKKDKKEKKAEKKDKKEKKEKGGSGSRNGSGSVAAVASSPLSSSASQRLADADKVLPLSEFPKYVDEFLKVRHEPACAIPRSLLTAHTAPHTHTAHTQESEDHRRALDGVGSTKDVFLTSLEMLSGALPVAKKDKKDKKAVDPLRHSIDNIKTKTKVEAFTRAELAERKDDLLRYCTLTTRHDTTHDTRVCAGP
jgi:hypothetical protein